MAELSEAKIHEGMDDALPGDVGIDLGNDDALIRHNPGITRAGSMPPSMLLAPTASVAVDAGCVGA